MSKSLRTHAPTAALGILAAVGLSGCNNRFAVPEPATQQGNDILTLWRVSLYAAVILGVLVLAVLCYSLIRHRRRSNELPKQTEGSVPIEIIYTVIPFIIVAALFFYGIKVQDDATRLTPATASASAQPLALDVTGYQWNWRFKYTADNVTVDAPDTGELPEMVLPVNKTVRFNLIAIDVNHSFFVPGFLTKRDLIPGVHNEIEVTPDRTGEFLGYCAEYCGLNHSKMNFKVRVVSQADYDAWIAQQKGKNV